MASARPEYGPDKDTPSPGKYGDTRYGDSESSTTSPSQGDRLDAAPPQSSGDGRRTGDWRAVLFPLLAPLVGLAVTVGLTAGLQVAIYGPPGLEVRVVSGSGSAIAEIASGPSAGLIRFARTDLRVVNDREFQIYLERQPQKASNLDPAGRWFDIAIPAAHAAGPEPKQAPDTRQIEQRQLEQRPLDLKPVPNPVPPANRAPAPVSYWPVGESLAEPPDHTDGFVDGVSQLRLGDAVLSFTTPGGLQVFNAIVHPATGKDGVSATLSPQAFTDVINGAVALALVKADDLGLTRLTIVQELSDRETSVTPEVWRDAVLAGIERVAGYLGHVRRIDIIMTTTSPGVRDDAVALATGGFWSSLLPRKLSVRFPLANHDALMPLRISDGGLEIEPATADTSAPAAAQRVVTLDRAALAPTSTLGATTSMLPALAGFAALLVFVAAGAVTADRRRHALKPLGEIPFAVRALVTLAVPLTLLVLSSTSWATGLNWSPDGQAGAAAWQSPLGVFALLIGAGAVSGYAWRSNAFKPLAAAPPAAVREQLRSTLIRDVPIEDWARQDRLGFRNLVLALARFLDNRDTAPPLVLAVTGPWGSGKSSVMRMLQKELDGTGRFHFAWFNAWQYREQDQILAAFLRTVARELSRKHGLGFMARIAWVRLSTASYGQLLKFSSPFLLLLAAYLVSDLWGSLGADAEPGTQAAGAKGVEDGDWLALVARIAEYGFTILGIGGTVELLRWAKPFQKPLSQLLAPPSSSSGANSTLEQFHSEFNLFRKAVGDAKFLIFVDDLDRCPPDAVVEVLKTINLIATCEDGPGKTFFVLGFDWNYILKSIEMHFEKFIGDGAGANGRFGRQYLKKIVTLPISVPKPSAARLAEFVGALETGPETASGSGDGTPPGQEASPVARAAERLRQFSRKPFNVVATLLVTLTVVVFLNHTFQSRLTEKPAGAISTAATPEAGASAVGATGERPAATDVTVTIGPPVARGADWSVALAALAIALGLGAAALAAVNLVEASRRRVSTPPEPRDSGDFVDAVRGLADRMPANPRDVIRLVNMMRVAHLVQSPSALRPMSTDDPDPGTRDIFSGTPLPAEASTRLTLLYYRWAGRLDVDRLENDLIPALERNEGLEAILTNPNNIRWAPDLERVLGEIPEGKALFADGATVRRFIEIYRHLLHADPVGTDDDEDGAGAPTPA